MPVIDYGFLDKKYAQFILKKVRLLNKFIAFTLGIYYFISEFFTKFHIYRYVSSYFSTNSISHNLFISFKNYYYETLFILHYGQILYGDLKSVKNFIGKTKYENATYLEEASSQNSPSIIVTAHIGCFFSGLFSDYSLFDIYRGKEICCLAPKSGQYRKIRMENKIREYNKDKLDNPEMFQLVDIQDKKCIFKIINVLKNNGLVICSLDLAYSYTKNIPVQFFNGKVELPVGLIEMGIKYKANVIPGFFCLEKNRYIFKLNKIIKLEDSTKSKDVISEYLSKIAAIIEKKVSEVPEQWTMWKSLNLIQMINNNCKTKAFIENNLESKRGLFFLPKNSNDYWDEKWLNEIRNFIPEAYKTANRYIPFTKAPRIIFVHKKRKNKIQKMLDYTKGVNLIPWNESILILNNNKNMPWRDMLALQMINLGIYNYIDHYVIPEWFIKSVSIGLACQQNPDNEAFVRFVRGKSFEIVDALIKDDNQMYGTSLLTQITTSFGIFLLKNYQSKDVKNIFIKSKELQSFNKGLKNALNVSQKDILNLWLTDLGIYSSENKAI